MKLATLPTEGRYLVDTLDAAYDVDLDAHIITRTDFADADDVRPDETLMFERIDCRVDDVMTVEVWLDGTNGDAEQLHRSTLVLGITPAPVEVVA